MREKQEERQCVLTNKGQSLLTPQGTHAYPEGGSDVTALSTSLSHCVFPV